MNYSEAIEYLNELGYVVQFVMDPDLEHVDRCHVQTIHWATQATFMACSTSYDRALMRCISEVEGDDDDEGPDPQGHPEVPAGRAALQEQSVPEGPQPRVQGHPDQEADGSGHERLGLNAR